MRKPSDASDETEHWADPCYAVVNKDGDYVGAHSGRKHLAEGLADDLDESNPDGAPHRVREQSFNDLPEHEGTPADSDSPQSGGDETDATEIPHAYDPDTLLEKFDSSRWRITNRLIDVDSDEVLYRVCETDSNRNVAESEIVTESLIDRSFERVDEPEIRTDGGIEGVSRVMDHKARLKCPVCDLEYGVAGLAAIGVSDGEERPCSPECERRLATGGDGQ